MTTEPSMPLTMTEHQELSREVQAANTFLRELCDVVVGAYGLHSRPAFSFLKVTEALESLCQDLRTQASQDHPGSNVDDLYVL